MKLEKRNLAAQTVNRRRFLSLATGGVLFPYAAFSIRAQFQKPIQEHASNNRRLNPQGWDPTTLTASWIGHSTVLMNFFGTTILTDPVLTEKVGIDVLGLFVYGPQRITPPALTFEELPPLEVILISHAHMDHMDLRTLDRFDRSMPVVVAANTGDILEDQGFTNVLELDWGKSIEIKDVTIEALQVKHNGARFPWEHARSKGSEDGRSCNAYLLSKSNVHAVFAGDTAYCEYFKPLRDRFPSIDLAIMPIGGYDPWENNHATPEQSVLMCKQMGARVILPVHWQTFVSTSESVLEPIERLKAALVNETIKIALDDIGEVWSLGEERPPDRTPGD